MNVGDLVGEPLVIHGLAKGKALTDRVADLFQRVGLPAEHMTRFPHEFSGGQRQRICIARALSLNPKIIIADECVSALDVSIQAQILELLKKLRADLGLSYLFISHDMAVVEQISHRVAVMYLGQIVETGPTKDVLGNPQHPYTKKLLAAVPIPDPRAAASRAGGWKAKCQARSARWITSPPSSTTAIWVAGTWWRRRNAPLRLSSRPSAARAGTHTISPRR